ncbi:PE family protein [Mycobacterium haemophilum]|uniref:PE domain-containing protein n=1 Tax=Mycobacterium haemophilum TaxID=29311 RepID=A0A0I9Z537_9MYCO|nr:PE family protein [Mycobacterium haemophilum]KLO28222.1 hypothetical protein ABH39_14465 [Mycobacterium haemophilum]KLO37828.1 hypothetical protein ABH38_06485 [Mycobacterium haemophilum]KLO43324.1 hypothetical protein ABH37_08595 [Mycobacterium haemophilum]KLO48102.1 hypothetical protein ABH36_15005 [Mycobacterium haemophilum]MCV7339403.1 PE family protein [Mycobacterium haemophilum DSM 44634]
MSFVTTVPEAMEEAAVLVEYVHAHMVNSSAAAAPGTTAVVPPANDAVSKKVAAHLARHAANYQEISAESALSLDRYWAALSDGAAAYSAAEAENTRAFN